VIRPLLAAGAAATLLLVAGAALGAAGFTDATGDTNAAPDLTAVEVSEAVAGTLTLRLLVANYSALPQNSWVNLWFDVDANPATGDDAGDEALVRVLEGGAIELYTLDGTRFVQGSPDGVTAAFAAGALTVTVPRTAIKAPAAFGVLTVASRGQPVGDEELVASDFLPDTGRASFTGPAATTFPDATGDHDAAPDLAAVRVSDAKNGWVTFSIATPNYAVLPEESVIVISIDADNNPRTGDVGTELQLVLGAGEIALARWDGRQFVADDLPTRARGRNAANVVSIDLHVSELNNSGRFRFSVLSADINTATQELLALDVAPDDFTFWRYALANHPALKLTVTRLSATPIRPRAGRPFAVNLSVTRSDTQRPITSGTVGCRVRAAGKPLVASGRISNGAGHCTLVVPGNAAGKLLRGTITVRSGGKSIAAAFTYRVR
jgi:hypothetical protein